MLCQRPGHPITREHIFAHWIVRQVHGARLIASASSPSLGSVTDPPSRISRVIAGVCADCNTGWMSVLEESFRRALFARPRTGILPAADRVTLSRWFTKTAVLLAHAHGGVLVGAADRPRLASGMPDDVEVFLARRRRPRQRLDFDVDLVVDRDVRSVAIMVDDLVAHVAMRGTLPSGHGTRLWPLRSHTIRWETLPVITSVAVRDADDRAKRAAASGTSAAS